MNQLQLNAQAALANVLAHMESHREPWQGIEPITETVATLNTLAQELKLSAFVQADGTGGTIAAKNMAFDLASQKAYTISRRVCAWARKHGKADILQSIDFAQTTFEQGAEEIRLQRMELVLKYAGENKTELSAYKVSDASLDDLKTAINTVEAMRRGRNDKSSHRIYSTANIDSVIEKIRSQLLILDDEVEGLVENNAFVDTYFISRRITDRKATRPKAEDAGAATA